MSTKQRVVVYPPEEGGGRRVRVNGGLLGPVYGTEDLILLLERSGLHRDDIYLEDPLLVDWRGGGPDVWAAEPPPVPGHATGS
ncbi:hypothetical protein [Streptomyces sp. NPDC086023]|uniref:hypothetical protein n=1 Tax=Streptomyces sp. NPDC086023 TaxID=3365746 RepID=UPI0037D86175